MATLTMDPIIFTEALAGSMSLSANYLNRSLVYIALLLFCCYHAVLLFLLISAVLLLLGLSSLYREAQGDT